jgi:asparagine synthase (glutamine-hydrolysing)
VALQEGLLADQGLLAARDPYAEGLRCFEEGSGELLERMSQADMQTYLVKLLMKQDQMSMAASIESRVPFLDHEFVESVSAVPGRFKLHRWRTKAVLREALRGLVPREILFRRKMGFPVPLARWFRGPFRSVVQEFVLGPRAARRGLFEPGVLRSLAESDGAGSLQGHRLWLLSNLEIWQRIFIDGEDPLAIRGASGA